MAYVFKKLPPPELFRRNGKTRMIAELYHYDAIFRFFAHRYLYRLIMVFLIGFFSGIACSGCSGWKFSERNDYFTAFNKDQDYTQGIRLERQTDSELLAWGQDIYTPAHKRIDPPLPSERPYAGLVYADYQKFAHFEGNTDYYYGVTPGLVGSAALGKQAQCGVHALLGQDCPVAWHSQLKNEPVFSLKTGLRQRELTNYGINTTTIGLEAGTLSVAMRLSTEVRQSFDRFFYFAGSTASLVAHDILLDGNTFVDSASTPKKVFFYELKGGIGWSFDTYTLDWFIAVRSPQFDGQSSSYNFGGVEIAWK